MVKLTILGIVALLMIFILFGFAACQASGRADDYDEAWREHHTIEEFRRDCEREDEDDDDNDNNTNNPK